jgi:bifunctional N-acetylglucosamine-1-phosphate-uridyltransferase/glucosamine-1-phosphate-acetyltransferase GlmU-like protein
MIVWTSDAYPNSRLNPEQYSWINSIEKKVIKKNLPTNLQSWEMITGNFTFKSFASALELIDELVVKNIRVNGEFYLDSLIELAFSRGMKVSSLNVENFIAIGTPEEYFTYKYFSTD